MQNKNRLKKIFKYIILIPVLLIIGALLYVMLILGETEHSGSTNLLQNNSIGKPARNLDLSQASFDTILEEFAAPMLVKNTLPQALTLKSNSSGSIQYTLQASFTTENNVAYTIIAQRPGFTMQNRNTKGLQVHLDKSINFAGMMGAWLENDRQIQISANIEDVNFLILFPKISTEEVMRELSLLSLNK